MAPKAKAPSQRDLTDDERRQLTAAFKAMPRYTNPLRPGEQPTPERMAFLQLFADIYNDGVLMREIGLALGHPHQTKWWKRATRAAGIHMRTTRLYS